MSYTTFAFDNLVATPPTAHSKEDVIVTVDVTNTGTVGGDETAQLYLHHDTSSVEVPDKALKGFSRIHLNSGEKRTVTFHIKQSELAIWNVRREWEVEPGTYTLYAGDSSDAPLHASFRIAKP